MDSACEGRCCKSFVADELLPQCKEKVKAGTEIIICIPQCIFSVLGPQLKEQIGSFYKNFESEMKESEVWDTKKKMEKRVMKAHEPKPLQLETNSAVLKELLKMVYGLNEELLGIGGADGSPGSPPRTADSDGNARTASKKRGKGDKEPSSGNQKKNLQKQKTKAEKGSSPRSGQDPVTPRREVVFNFMGLDQVK